MIEIEVFKIIHNYYDTGASVKSNFDPVGSTRGNNNNNNDRLTAFDPGQPG